MPNTDTIKETRVKKLEAAVRDADKALVLAKQAVYLLSEARAVADTFEPLVDVDIDHLAEYIDFCGSEVVELVQDLTNAQC